MNEEYLSMVTKEDLAKERIELLNEIARLRGVRATYAARIEELYRLACPECRRKFDGGEK